MNNDNVYFANCALGVETLITRELEQLGGKNIEAGRGTVSWHGDLESGYRTCLWSRFASRILMNLTRFTVANDEDLYQGCLGVEWLDHMDVTTTFAINCTLASDSPLTHSQFASLRVKDAIVDYFRDKMGERPSVKTSRPDVQLHLHISGNEASLSLDLSGESLHKRGYRVAGGMAPLKETLAAAIVGWAGWQEKMDTAPALIDPMCGTGTLLIEAALMFGDVAPGLSRSYFGFVHWKQHDSALWDTLIEEAVAREEVGLDKKWPFIMGYDADPVVVSAARQNIVRAGLEDFIQIKCSELTHLGSPLEKGMIICNLPYGERLSEAEKVRQLYRAFGRIGRERFAGWDLAVFISNPDLAESFEVQWDKKYRLYNGSIPCRLYIGCFDADQSSPFVWKIKNSEGREDGADFANRFKKNLGKYLKWAEKENISCFRVYDRDLPDYNLSVDLYGKWIYVQEYLPPKTVDPEQASNRFNIALRSIRDTLGVRSDRVFVKRRQRQKGKEQNQQQGSKKKMYPVREGDAHFLVNFRDYPDTGLFLDQRPMRLRIGQEVRGKRFLNLYGHTGTASVHAALGGAINTTSVDLSATNLEWTETNLALNGFAENNHRAVHADCLEWLETEIDLYDCIFVDPPKFSKAQKKQRIFDIQPDHLALLTRTMARLAPGGTLIFTTNLRKFELDKKLAELFEIQQITESTIPFDFSRNSKIHYCWELRHKN